MALYSLNYDSNTLLNNTTTIASTTTVIEPENIQTSLIEAKIQTLSPSEAFHILTTLANQEKYTEAYFWIGNNKNNFIFSSANY